MRKKNDADEYSYSENGGREKGNALTFFIGILILGVGVYLIFQNTIVTSNFGLSSMIGFEPPFGLVLLPLIIGIIVLFVNEKSILGWLLVIFGVIFILLGILMGLHIRFKPTTVFVTILMYGMTAAGIGTTLKGLFGRSK
jgi:hypothetical protein